MLTAVDSFTLTLHNQPHTLNVTGNSVSVKENSSLNWKGPCEVSYVNPIYNSSSSIYVKLANDTGYVLEVGKVGLKEVLKLSFCPCAVYATSDFLIYNDKKSCHLYHVKSGKQSAKLNHQIVGFDFRTDSYILKLSDESHVYLNSVKLKPYKNVCLKSVTSLPITWVSVLSSSCLTLGTSYNRVMFVRDGIIKSHFKLSHSIEYILPVSDIQIRVSGSGVVSEMSVPVLGLVTNPEVEEGDISSAMRQLSVSCDNHIKKQLTELNKLYFRKEKKVEFLTDIWNKLFEIEDTCVGEDNSFSNHESKRRKVEGLSTSSARDQLPYQIPIPPNTSTQTSTYTQSDNNLSVYCSDVAEPLLGSHGDYVRGGTECVQLSRNCQFENTHDPNITPEFSEKLRRMFAEALVSGKNDPMIDSLAHLTNMVLAIDET